MCTKGAQREENYNKEEKGGGEGGERKESTNSATRVF
jgi:hypothetical protein